MLELIYAKVIHILSFSIFIYLFIIKMIAKIKKKLTLRMLSLSVFVDINVRLLSTLSNASKSL